MNGADSRFYVLRLISEQPFYQIATDGGFLNETAQVDQLVIFPAERADVILDFSELAGEEIVILNFGPDDPFKGFESNGEVIQGSADPLPKRPV